MYREYGQVVAVTNRSLTERPFLEQIRSDNGVLTVTFPKEAKKKVPEEKKFISIEG